MTALGEKVLFALLPEKASMDYLASEGLSDNCIPSDDLRPIYKFCLDYYEQSGHLGAPTAAVLKETLSPSGDSYYDLLSDHEIIYEDELPSESIQWAIQDLRDTYLAAETQKQVRTLIEEMAALPPGGGERLTILARGAQRLMELATQAGSASTPGGGLLNAADIEDLATVIKQVDDAPPPKYLVRPFIAEGDHGMFGAADKTGKTWAMGDLAVSVSSGTPWFGIFEVEAPGPVLMFVGEGGKRKIVRRMRAICRARGIDPATLPIRVCARVPHLSNEAALAVISDEIAKTHPSLVIIDPLYLAARGAKGSDLYGMGDTLEPVQVICQRYGAALFISHHFKKTGDTKGAQRYSGVGPSAWGRVLFSAAVISRETDGVTKATTTTLQITVQGDEVADTAFFIRRRIWADDPNDLTCAMHYEVEKLDLEVGHGGQSDDGLGGSLSATRRCNQVLEEADDRLSVQEIGDRLNEKGWPLKKRTIQHALVQLEEQGRARRTPPEPVGGSTVFWVGVRRADIAAQVSGGTD